MRAKILNVDDDRIHRYIRTQVLMQAGYDVVEAETGKEALAQVTAEQPQLILLDINLPDMTGVEVCRRIKEDEASARSTMILHISATHTALEDQVLGLEGGADGYLVEPVDPERMVATVRSLLRLRTAEARLAQSLAHSRGLVARWQSLTEAVPHVIYTSDAEGRWDYVSQQFRTATGHDPAEAMQFGWVSFVHPDDRDSAIDLWAKSITAGEPFEIQYRLHDKEGSYRWHVSRATPVRDLSGNIVQWVGTSTDVQDRETLNEEVRRRHQEFVALAEHSPDIICRLDRNLCYTYVNSGISRMSALAPEHCIGKTSRELGWPESLCSSWDEKCRKAFETAVQTQFEFAHEVGGVKRYFESRIVPEFDCRANVQSLLAIVTDITERKSAENALMESERRMRRLIESNLIGVVVANPERIVQANDVFLNIVGYTREDLEAGGLNWREMTPPEFAPADDRALQELADRGACKPFEKEYWRKDRSRVPILIGAAALGDASEWVCFILDLTDQKESETALRRANAALQRSNDDLRDFAHTASHDLQEPLRSLGIYTELLIRKLSAPMDPEIENCTSQIAGSVARMQGLIRDLLAFSQVQSAGTPLLTPIDSTAAVQLAVSNLKSAVDESGASIAYSGLPRVRADAAQLTQIFQNLIGNAIKYRKPGEAPRIDISAKRRDDAWVFCVRDNGIGFEQKYADRIFGVFKRLHGREIPGTGVGLAIVKKIIERHGGQIWAESSPGQGAAFYFELSAV